MRGVSRRVAWHCYRSRFLPATWCVGGVWAAGSTAGTDEVGEHLRLRQPAAEKRSKECRVGSISGQFHSAFQASLDVGVSEREAVPLAVAIAQYLCERSSPQALAIRRLAREAPTTPSQQICYHFSRGTSSGPPLFAGNQRDYAHIFTNAYTPCDSPLLGGNRGFAAIVRPLTTA